MSTRIHSPWGSLGDRIAARPDARAVHPCPQGRWVEFRTDDGHWVPALLAAWERQPDRTWWGRVVIVEDGAATEILTTATRLRPPS